MFNEASPGGPATIGRSIDKDTTVRVHAGLKSRVFFRGSAALRCVIQNNGRLLGRTYYYARRRGLLSQANKRRAVADGHSSGMADGLFQLAIMRSSAVVPVDSSLSSDEVEGRISRHDEGGEEDRKRSISGSRERGNDPIAFSGGHPRHTV